MCRKEEPTHSPDTASTTPEPAISTRTATSDPRTSPGGVGPTPPESPPTASDSGTRPRWTALIGFLLMGVYLGVIFIQSEVISWFRIQEMFRFQSFHMYGIIGSAVAVGMISIRVIRAMNLRTVSGEPIELSPKEWGSSRIPAARYWMGGTLFGMGWALLGACPGPMYALVGAGISVIFVALFSAFVGTWAYSALRGYLPH